MPERPFALAKDQAATDLAAVQRVIADAAADAALLERDVAVCAHIVAGFSAEGSALDLGISPHSVVTYRRRAFAKLGIPMQKDLFSLIL